MATQVQDKTNSLSRAVTMKELNISSPEKSATQQQFAVWVRSLLQNWRQGTVASKGRGEVAYTNKKPWKQKGTGRARAGSARSPLWRGGGVIFGPQERSRKLTVPQKVKQQVIAQLIIDRIKSKNLIVADWTVINDRPSTSHAAKLLKQLSLDAVKVTLLVPTNDLVTYASFVNLPNVQIILFDQLNAYDLANSPVWLVLNKDFNAFKEIVGQWQ